MEFHKKSTIAALFSISTFFIPAYATVINFDTIGVANNVFPHYTQAGFTDQGFTFSGNEDVVDISSSAPWSNFGPAFSGNYAALNDYGGSTAITMVGGGKFDFNSIYIKGWGSSSTGVLEAYSNGLLVGSVNFSADSSTWSQSIANFKNVNSVVVNGQTLLLDDVNVSVSAVPEPESYAMLLAGLGLMGFMVRRRKTS